MAQHPVTVEEHLLASLFSRHDGLGQLVEERLNPILQAQAAEALQAGPMKGRLAGRATATGSPSAHCRHGEAGSGFRFPGCRAGSPRPSSSSATRGASKPWSWR